jgi:hypothetical protein
LQVSVTIGDKDDDTSAAEARGAQSIVLPIEGQGRRKITINTAELEDKVQADAIFFLARPVSVIFLLMNLIVFIRARPVRLLWN